ncbi:UPF0688 protein C1orf174 homolog [Thalassophryne amazonica]|uniref:UPF0688 protein C1orf174 homolog n=1 Tax=Thalassophryne amazonica TaxID=390379 RepID=UPI001470D3F1|nr:UPF0688 protein C1orf174 homolog [Thalassophryne amazonica]
MAGQHGNMKHRKRKNSSDGRQSTKGCASKRKGNKRPKMTAVYSSGSGEEVGQRLSAISCECLQTAGRTRCSSSPSLEEWEGKENDMRMQLDLSSHRVHSKRDSMDDEDSTKNIFPDDDSNQILPVEQFFGNMDAVQDLPQRSSSSDRVRRQHRRRRYYAREESDEEGGLMVEETPDDLLL